LWQQFLQFLGRFLAADKTFMIEIGDQAGDPFLCNLCGSWQFGAEQSRCRIASGDQTSNCLMCFLSIRTCQVFPRIGSSPLDFLPGG
jgi:hypothetical protein